MKAQMKTGDLYSYATIHIESHGFLIRAHEDFMYSIEYSEASGQLHASMQLEIGSDGCGNSLNINIKPEDVDVVISDPRPPVTWGFIMVYRSGKSAKQVYDLIRPQLNAIMDQRIEAFKTLLFNAHEMLAVLRDDDKFENDYLCSTAAK